MLQSGSDRAMYELRVTGDFAAAHQLRNVTEKCENLHGHNFQVEAAVWGETLTDAGVLMDFGILKRHLREILGFLDHTFLNELPVFQGENASSERLARFIAEELGTRLAAECDGVTVRRVRVWESGNASAAFYPVCVTGRNP